jgi:hypothetical protein
LGTNKNKLNNIEGLREFAERDRRI